jgi:hypothetical protein
MGIHIKLSRNRLAYLIHCIRNNLPLSAGPGGWTAADLLTLAGVAFHEAREDVESLEVCSEDAAKPVDGADIDETILNDMMAVQAWCDLAVEIVENDAHPVGSEVTHEVVATHTDEGPSFTPISGLVDMSDESEDDDEGTSTDRGWNGQLWRLD